MRFDGMDPSYHRHHHVHYYQHHFLQVVFDPCICFQMSCSASTVCFPRRVGMLEWLEGWNGRQVGMLEWLEWAGSWNVRMLEWSEWWNVGMVGKLEAPGGP